MINVSFNELAIINELPVPRSATRPADVSAFSTMLDEADSRQDLPTNNDTRDSAAEPRATPPSERKAAPEAEQQNGHGPNASAAQENAPKQPSPVAESRNDNVASGVETATNKPDTQQTVTAADTTEKLPTDDTLAVNFAAVAAPIQIPTKLADVQLNFSPADTVAAVAPQATGPAVPLPQGDSDTHPSAQAASSPVVPATPNTLPGAPQSNEAALSPTASRGVADSTMAAMPAAATGKVMPETLFAVTTLSQAMAPELNDVPPPSPAAKIASATLPPTGLPTAPLNDAASATPGMTKLSEIALPLESTPPDARAPQPALMNPPSTGNGPSATTTPPSQAKDLATMLGGEGIEITFAQVAESVPTKPAPALANGMVTQIGAALSPEGQAKTLNISTTASSIGPADSLAAPNASYAQTAMAVPAAPMIQAATDEPQPKFAATADGLMVNTLGSAAGTHAPYAAAAEAASTGKAPLATPPVIDQVAVHVAKAAAEGIDKINIKLKPATLGQIEVQLEIASDGRIHAIIAADKPETLDLLQRDARALERALGDAGLRTDSGSLSFNLRGQGQQNGDPGHTFAGFSGGVTNPAVNDSAFIGNTDRIGAYLNSRAAAGGVDIRV